MAAEDAAADWRREGAARPPMGRDPRDSKDGLLDSLPDFVGYSALYVVSAIPLFIVAATIFVLWSNSLR